MVGDGVALILTVSLSLLVPLGHSRQPLQILLSPSTDVTLNSLSSTSLGWKVQGTVSDP